MITPDSDKEYLETISEFYNKYSKWRIRFCLEIFDIDDNKSEDLSIFDHLKKLPIASQVKCKNC